MKLKLVRPGLLIWDPLLPRARRFQECTKITKLRRLHITTSPYSRLLAIERVQEGRMQSREMVIRKLLQENPRIRRGGFQKEFIKRRGFKTEVGQALRTTGDRELARLVNESCVVPTAYLIDREHLKVVAFEVELTRPMSVNKYYGYVDLWWAFDGSDNWEFEVLVVDRRGQVKQIDVTSCILALSALTRDKPARDEPARKGKAVVVTRRR